MIIIAGGGISGLTIGRNLNREFLLLEKNEFVGGISTQYNSAGYWYDFGGHYFHFKDKPDIKEYILTLDKFKSLKRNSKVFLLNRFIPFPVQFHLYSLPENIKNTVIKEIPAKNPSPDIFLYKNLKNIFGKTLYDLFFKPFLEKYYQDFFLKVMAGKDKGSIPVPSKEDVIKGYKGEKFSDRGYNPLFYYPENALYQFMQKYKIPAHSRIKLKEEIIRIDLIKKRVFTRNSSYEYQYLINTLPLKNLLGMIVQRDEFPHRNELSHISTKIINVTLRRRLKRFHWVYLPQKEFLFYRVGYYPYKDYVACYLERTVSSQEIPAKDRLSTVAVLLKKLGMIEKKSDILHLDEITIPISHIIINKDWHKRVPGIIENLKKYDVYTTGRYGRWHYSSMSDDVLDARILCNMINNNMLI